MLALLSQILLLVLAAESSAFPFATVSNAYERVNDHPAGSAKQVTNHESTLAIAGIGYGQSPPSRGYLPPQSPPSVRYPPPSHRYLPPIQGHPPPIHRHPPPSQYPPPSQRSPTT
ncbi:hypothetical protein SCA6_010281 [Theobroma cacao]